MLAAAAVVVGPMAALETAAVVVARFTHWSRKWKRSLTRFSVPGICHTR